MAAVTARTITEKRTAAADVAVKCNAVYTRVVQFTVEDGATAGSANLTGFTIPAGTLILGGTVKFSAAQGSCTWKFTAGTDICAATAYNSTTETILGTFAQTLCAADTQVAFTTASAATVAGTCTLTLVLAATGTETSGYAPVGV